ncbi:hypothetical protein RM844_30535 [Streptomyces sp. DSM 44915]|uniref:YbaB/EbfC DNA-binding family protein n=1 Tax=Streptomyces chisholmiae TaxID=3075540 RepID=A0ABU2K1I2_9ACTN|nr:hypothetical protein [Streptomyces sp. DSM 44915]MDT0270619.1 hypothetical protein [Streptomyces sp. DSM 44915]
MKLSDLALEEAALKTLADTVTERLKDVRAAMQCELDDVGVGQVEARLPDGTKVATISRTSPKPAAAVTDAEKFLAWVRETYPPEVVSRVVTEVRTAFATRLLKEMTAAGVAQVCDTETGEVHDVPGVEIRATRAASHSVRPVDGGREAIAEAWRSGALAHLAIPQITGQPAGEDGAR